MTKAQKEALAWLQVRGGDGVFAEKNRVVLHAQGERGPFTRSTWNELVRSGHCETYGRHRLRIVRGANA